MKIICAITMLTAGMILPVLLCLEDNSFKYLLAGAFVYVWLKIGLEYLLWRAKKDDDEVKR